MDKRLRKLKFITAFFILLFAGCPNAEKADSIFSNQIVWQKVDEELARFQQQNEIPGMSVAVLIGDEIAFSKGYGWANREKQIPVTPDTIFPIASIEKQFTAAAVMRLAEEGKLRLNDPVTKYLPDLDTGGYVITIRDMLQQVSGLQEDDTLEARQPQNANANEISKSFPSSEIRAGEGFEPGKYIARFRNQPLYLSPRTRYNYSQPNYDLMCFVIAKVSGKTYYEAIGDLAKSAGLKTFYPNWTPVPPRDDPNVAHGYRRQENKIMPFWEENTGSGWTTAIDLARWSRALEEGAGVSRESYAEMTKPAKLKDGSTSTYGLGLVLEPFEGKSKIMHTGSITGFYGVLARYSDDDISIAILTNLGRSPFIQVIERRIARIIFGIKQPEIKDLKISEQEKSCYSGSYDAGSFWFEVVMDGDYLELRIRQPDYIENARTFIRTKLLYQGDGKFIGADEPDWLQISFEQDLNPAREIKVSFPVQTPTIAVRRSSL